VIIGEQVVIWTWDVGGPKAALVLIGLLWSVPLLWRKRYPLAVPLLIGGVAFSEESSRPGPWGPTTTTAERSRVSRCSTRSCS
jgi:hypothetical protein